LGEITGPPTNDRSMEGLCHDLAKKCVWKVREIGFLRVVIESNGIEMEKEKMDGCQGRNSEEQK